MASIGDIEGGCGEGDIDNDGKRTVLLGECDAEDIICGDHGDDGDGNASRRLATKRDLGIARRGAHGIATTLNSRGVCGTGNDIKTEHINMMTRMNNGEEICTNEKLYRNVNYKDGIIQRSIRIRLRIFHRCHYRQINMNSFRHHMNVY